MEKNTLGLSTPTMQSGTPLTLPFKEIPSPHHLLQHVQDRECVFQTACHNKVHVLYFGGSTVVPSLLKLLGRA